MSKTMYVVSSGTLRRRNDTLMVEREDAPPRYVPVEMTDEIVVIGEATVNKGLLELLEEHQIILHFFNWRGNYVGTYWPKEHNGSGPALLAQAACCSDPARRQAVASAFVAGGIGNMREVVRYYQRRRDDLEAQDILDALDRFEGQAAGAQDVPQLMGIEGNARSCYYQLFDRLMGNGPFRMGKRTRRPPSNIMNAMISFLNSLCYTLALSQIYRTHLDPRISFLHEPSDRRLSLHLDLAEVFKPLLVDRLIFALVGRRSIREEHFARDEQGRIRMTKEGHELVMRAWDERLDKTIEHPQTGRRPTGKTGHPVPPSALGHPARRASWKRLVRMEAQKLEKHVMGRAPYQPFIWRG